MTVCSGNICRSPLAEGLLRKGLSGVEGITVSSAGTIAGEGDPVTEQTLEIGREFGVDLGGHRARYLLEPMVTDADLLFAMSRSHRRAIVELVPRKVSTTFTLREFARLADAVPDAEFTRAATGHEFLADRLRAVVRVVAGMRGQVDQPADPTDDDVVDPYRRSGETYRLSASQLVPAVDTVIRVLTLGASA
ncbi:hypothetical protein B7R54_03115 [Subtercola boreus]|uniref:Phosphotyrosine protein phosphatase I domain-containing protein n=1 Tax=Subtercola boreus TaxID=120213 RepID=A0A3E0VF98_9MICO|nr:low molecular weight phosphatase family protein [Subtercola boreus]RFA08325.1 hypothetical protein B7R54_03115 [Subtercola boreus]